MANLRNTTGFLLLTALILTAVSCGSSEEVRVVDTQPRSGPVADTSDSDEETFMQLNVGLLEPIDNFDPLFINNQSSMRVLSLIYDGLFTVDTEGNPVPALASTYEISDDSLTYTIRINRDIFYHDSEAFLSGIGRRIQASDIKWAFERAARSNVPDNAAKLLMNIEGYEDYFDDQRFIYDPDRRVLDEVSGISVVDEQTIRFRLIEPDPDFMNKLASPYLFIYPREALQRNNRSLKSQPVGTGAYRLNEQQDGTTVLVRAQSDTDSERVISPRLNRINFLHSGQESNLFRQFAAEEIDWIPEMGSETRDVALDDEDSLVPGYADQYSLHRQGTRLLYIYINESRRSNIAWLKNRFATLEADTLNTTGGTATVINQPEPAEGTSIGDPDDTYYVMFTSDPHARSLLRRVQRTLLETDSEFGLTDIQTPVSRTSVYTVSTDPFHSALFDYGTNAWLRYTVQNSGISHPKVEGLMDSEVSWKLFVEPIRVNSNSGDSE